MDSLFGFFIWRPLLAFIGWMLSAAAMRFEIIELTTNYFISLLADKYAVPQFTAFLLIIFAHLISPVLIQFFHKEKPYWQGTGRTLNGRAPAIHAPLTPPPQTASIRIRTVQKTILNLFPAFFAAISISAARKVDLRIRNSLCVIHMLAHFIALVLSPFPFTRQFNYVLYHIALGSLLALLCFALLPHVAARYMELAFHLLLQLHLGKQWLHQTVDKFNFWSTLHDEF